MWYIVNFLCNCQQESISTQCLSQFIKGAVNKVLGKITFFLGCSVELCFSPNYFSFFFWLVISSLAWNSLLCSSKAYFYCIFWGRLFYSGPPTHTESALGRLWKSEVFISGQKSPIPVKAWIYHLRYPVDCDFLLKVHCPGCGKFQQPHCRWQWDIG